MNEGQSPEAIAGRITHHEKNLPNISKNTVYRYMKSPYGKLLGFRFKKKYYRKKRTKVTKLKDRVFIDKRPVIIDQRKRVGDAEGDFIVSGRSGKGILLVVVDRKIRVVFLEIIHAVTIDEVHNAFERIKTRFPEMRTVTLDNDILFQMHHALAKLLDVKIYFCHPYHSWEKGSVEHANKIIRRFIPKGSDLSRYDQGEIGVIEGFLNSRYMECLRYATPQEKLELYRRRRKKQPLRAGE